MEANMLTNDEDEDPNNAENLSDSDQEVAPQEDQETAENESEVTAESGDTSIDLENISGSDITIDIGDKIYFDMPSQGIKVIDLADADIFKIKNVYIETSKWVECYDKLTNRHLLIINGDSHTGKYATAIRASLELVDKSSGISIRSLRFSEDASLIDFLIDEKCPSNSIFLVQDAFLVPGLGITEIQRYSTYLTTLLLESNNYVIITTDKSMLMDAELPEQLSVETSSFSTGDLNKILKKHLSFYKINETTKDLIEAKKQHVIPTLKTAHNIDRFIQIVAKLPVFNEQVLDETLARVSNVNLDASLWFRGLNANQRYYAMLIALCPQLDRNNLWVVYDKVVTALRSKKVSIDSPLNFSEEDLRLATNSVLTEMGYLEFEDHVYEEQVFQQIKDGYSQQFKSLLPIFSSLILETNSDRSTENRDFRIALATAIGEIAKASWATVVVQVFKNLTQHPDSAVRSSVAHSIRRTAGDPARKSDIVRILSKWKASPSNKVRWTSAAVSERIYHLIPQEAFEILDDLSNDRDSYVRKAVAHAIAAIARRDLEAAIQIILEWISTKRKRTKRTAGSVFIRLLENSKRLKYALEDSDYKARLIPLISELMVQGGGQLKVGLSLLQGWIVVGSDNQTLLQSIEDSVLATCSNVSSEIRDSIVLEIKNEWVQSEDESLYRFSVVLIDLIQKLPESEEPQIPTQYFIFDDEEVDNDVDFEYSEDELEEDNGDNFKEDDSDFVIQFPR